MLKRGVTVVLAGVLTLAGYTALGGAAFTQAATPKPVATRPSPPKVGAGLIAVTAREFLYDPKQFVLKAGDTTFAVKNAGAIDHDFVIEDAKNKTIAQANPFAAGKWMEVKAKLVPGTYSIFCSIPGHREAGMSGTLKVLP